MKFKGQGEINICGVEYKKNIADSRRGGFRAPKKNPVSAPGWWQGPAHIYTQLSHGQCHRRAGQGKRGSNVFQTEEI